MIISLLMYPGGESNPYLKFRKLPFYPLNYQGYGLAVSVINLPSGANLRTFFDRYKRAGCDLAKACRGA